MGAAFRRYSNCDNVSLSFFCQQIFNYLQRYNSRIITYWKTFSEALKILPSGTKKR